MDKWRPGLGPIPEKALKGEALTHCTGHVSLRPTRRNIMLNLDTQTRHGNQCALCRHLEPYSIRLRRPTQATVRNLQLQVPLQKCASICPSSALGASLADILAAALQSLFIIPRSPYRSPLQIKDDDDVLVNDLPALEGEVPPTDLKEEQSLKREHSALLAGAESDDEVLFVSASKRRQPNITVNENGVEVIDLT